MYFTKTLTFLIYQADQFLSSFLFFKANSLKMMFLIKNNVYLRFRIFAINNRLTIPFTITLHIYIYTSILQKLTFHETLLQTFVIRRVHIMQILMRNFWLTKPATIIVITFLSQYVIYSLFYSNMSSLDNTVLMKH